MGAQLWCHEAPWHPDADATLKALQARFLAENYDLPALLAQHLAWARESVVAAQDDGDPYGVLDIYQEKVRLLERLCSHPIPDSPEAQIEIVRRINADSGEGIGNVLDVTGVSSQRDIQTAQRLSQQETARLAGATQPTLAQANKAVGKINKELGRGECVCFPFYEKGKPVGWYFVGNTID
ncbi:MAG TPA: hypothetical protein VMY37_27245 [Thermoguttaceae bacterium]|nr:hypothetical protein [Thermoguttaceae bacterium]